MSEQDDIDVFMIDNYGVTNLPRLQQMIAIRNAAYIRRNDISEYIYAEEKSLGSPQAKNLPQRSEDLLEYSQQAIKKQKDKEKLEDWQKRMSENGGR